MINSIIGYFWERKTLLKNDNNHIAYYTALNTTMYLASVIEVAMVSYLFINYNVDPSPT